MQQQLRVDTAAVQTMAARWDASVGKLSEAVAPVRLGLSCQASAVAVNAAHTDIRAFAATLATQVCARATAVAAADTCYVDNEADSSNELAAVARPVTGGW